MEETLWQVLIYFDKLYKVMNDVERRQLIEALISEVQIYEEKQTNGQWLKSIIFKLLLQKVQNKLIIFCVSSYQFRTTLTSM